MIASVSPSAGPSRSRRTAWLLLRVLFAVGLTAYLVWDAHPGKVLGVAAAANWTAIGVAVLLVLVDRALMAYRWIALLCTIEPQQRPRFGALMRIFFTSTFAGTLLPASIGSDAVRAYEMRKLSVAGGDAVASVLMDRMLGVAAILIMAIAGVFIARDLASDTTILLGLGVTAAACTATLLMIFSAGAARLASTVLALVPVPAVRRIGDGIVDSIRKYASFPGPLVSVLLGSVLVQVLRILQAYYLGVSLGIEASLADYFAFIPLILLVILLPITFNGIGTAQLAFVWFFAHAGVDNAHAIALSILFIALGVIGNLPGALLFVAGRGRRAE